MVRQHRPSIGAADALRNPTARTDSCLQTLASGLSSAKKAERRRGRRDAMLHELRATHGAR
jgi:hypothetical protein